ncbi:MAG: ATP-dependent zinc metalloprotease FtsH, partial [Clostridia bacterium]|nr:ATP-dependent zinc metalloprotease FtsH [Clostridia bacterium]
MKNSLKVIIFYVALIAIVLFASSVVFDTVEQEKTLYSDIISYFTEEQVEYFLLTSDNELQLSLKDKTVIVYELRSYETYELNFAEIAEQQYLDGIISDYDIEPPTSYPWWLSLLPYLLVIVFFVAMWVYVMNQANGKGGGRNNIAGFGKARAKLGSDEKKKILFSDVAGADEEKEELREIVDFL